MALFASGRDLKTDRIEPVPTVQETRASFEFGDAYVVEIIQKCAAKISKVLDTTFPSDPSLPLNHIRRFVKDGFLPEPLKVAIEEEKMKFGIVPQRSASSPLQLSEDVESAESAAAAAATIFILIQPPLPDLEQLRALLAPFVPPSHIFSSSSEKLGQDDQTAEESGSGGSFPIYRIKIPLQPPLNQHQADEWSKTIWPVSFNAAFPRSMNAPPPKILEAIKTSIAPKARFYLDLAGRIAQESKKSRRGRGIGVVIVDPAILSATPANQLVNVGDYDNAIVAVAGDARYCAPRVVVNETERSTGEGADANGGANTNTNTNTNTNRSTNADTNSGDNADYEGGPEYHAIMRAIEMVAVKRRAGEKPKNATTTTTTTTSTEKREGELSTPEKKPPRPKIRKPFLTPMEAYYLNRPHLSSAVDIFADNSANINRILPRSAGGYLCTDLDIYITHEPCLACSMGMLLSRFRAVTFPRKRRLVTGGLASMEVSSLPLSATGQEQEGEDLEQSTDAAAGDVVVGDDDDEEKTEQKRATYYGLHWRKELNWRAMCFEFIEGDDNENENVVKQPNIEEVGYYHA